ncbi:hypothetical protein RFZ50_07315, partial [Acinetobacter baumannii]
NYYDIISMSYLFLSCTEQELIKSAYSSKLFEDPLIKSKAVENFQTTWHEQCLAKELAKNM